MYDYSIYKNRCSELLKGMKLKEYSILNDYTFFSDIITEEEFKKIINEKQRRKNKRYRTDRKIYLMQRVAMALERNSEVKTRIVFITLTLDDKTLSTKENTYIRKVHKWLKEHFVVALLNKDYGKNNEREHYHAIALTAEPLLNTNIRSKKGYSLYKLKKQDYTLGFEPTLEIVDMNDKESVRNYLLKLNNHSNKDTASSSRLRVITNPYFKIFYEIRKT